MTQPLMSDHVVQPADRPGMSVQNPHCIRYVVDQTMLARQGAMVAYRGDLTLRTKSQGLRNLLKRAATSEGVALMEVSGQGEIWLADTAKRVFVVAGDNLCVAGQHVLCFDSSLHYDIRMIKGAGMGAGGLFNCLFSGPGQVGLTAHGEPMVLPVTKGDPVWVDTDAVIGWTASLKTSIHRSESFTSWVKGGSGEVFQLCLEGHGAVAVQPSEGFPAQSGDKGGVVDTIGQFLG